MNTFRRRRFTALMLRNPAIVPTVITVLAGGVITALITGWIQGNNREKELAMMAYKDYADAELKTTTAVFDIVGRYAAASAELIELTRRRLAVGTDSESAALRRSILAEYNASQREWRSTRYKVELLLRHYHRNRGAVPKTWMALTDALDSFNSCAIDWYRTQSQIEDESASVACGETRRQVRDAFRGFTDALDDDRRSTWNALGIRLREP